MNHVIKISVDEFMSSKYSGNSLLLKERVISDRIVSIFRFKINSGMEIDFADCGLNECDQIICMLESEDNSLKFDLELDGNIISMKEFMLNGGVHELSSLKIVGARDISVDNNTAVAVLISN